MQISTRSIALVSALLLGIAINQAYSSGGAEGVKREYAKAPPAPVLQSKELAQTKSAGCISCHTDSEAKTMHQSPSVVLGCTDCHGGNAGVIKPSGVDGSYKTVKAPDELKYKLYTKEKIEFDIREYAPAFQSAMDQAHILPSYRGNWPTSANPAGSYADLNKESPEFIRFINPGDLRAAREACGACHLPTVQAVERSLMSSSAMLWGGASYNNGILPYKRYILGEAYNEESEGSAITAPLLPTEAMTKRGILPKLNALPAWETVPPADVFRVFERGGRNINTIFPEIAVPSETGSIQKLEEPGRPDLKQSNRGPGTGNRIAVPVLNVHKSRLNDPHLWFLGTNDNPGDFRSSGCSGCHVTYANDRDIFHSGPYAKFGNTGQSQQKDPTIPKLESGHPITHEFTRSIPTSQCMICHMHQPNMFINSMLGYTMWDYESDAKAMWPEKQKYPSDSEIREINARNPEEAAIRGKWSDPNFLKEVSSLNPSLKDTQFADYHGHGWNFRAVYKRDRKGNLLDAKGSIVSDEDEAKFDKAVHLKSIHIEKGMHCVDCHFEQDMHGNGHIVGEVQAGVEIQCQDCHGTVDEYAGARTTGPMASQQGRNLFLLRNPDGKKRFEWKNGELIQRSLVNKGMEWAVRQTKDIATPSSKVYNAKATRAHTVSYDTTNQNWGASVPKNERAHNEDKMMCYTCHTSWTTSCGGCHLPIQANWKSERQHYEGGATRNFATYNPQVARDDIFQLGIHGEIKGNKIAPVRSSSALVLSSTNTNRERIYIQQPPVSAAGFSSQAFAPHYPHTERTTETKTCTDCHVSKKNDNNAIMTQLLLQGTKFADFIGFNSWVGGDGEINAVQVTEWDEPQAVIGSYLHKFAYPDYFAKHKARQDKLPEAHRHQAGVAQCIQLRGEYLFVAEGKNGMRAYDVASIANKGFSQRIISAPFSKWGQNTNIASKDASCVVLPTTQPVAPNRNQGDLMRKTNQEQAFHPIYNYAFITDRVEGLIATDVNTLADGEFRNNKLTRAITWNGNGVLNGVQHLAIGGRWFYLSTPKGLVVLDMNNPLKPEYVTTVPLNDARAAQVQFRYVFVTTRDGLEVIDITEPTLAHRVAGIKLENAHKLHVARTFAYVANGAEGLAIIDVEQALNPRLYQMYNAGGSLNDARDVTVATTNASLFAYVADGKNGLKVVQLTSPESQPKFYGFSPDPKPVLVSQYQTKKAALSLSRALERDRAVDETGGQIAVLGRIGSRPFNDAEMKKLYLDKDGKVWTVSDTP